MSSAALSPTVEPLLTGLSQSLAAEHERGLGWLGEGSAAQRKGEGAARRGPSSGSFPGKEEVDAESAEAPRSVHRQLQSVTRRLAVRLASAALQEALSQLELILDLGLGAASSSPAFGSQDAKEEKLEQREGPSPYQEKLEQRGDDAARRDAHSDVIKAKLSTDSAPQAGALRQPHPPEAGRAAAEAAASSQRGKQELGGHASKAKKEGKGMTGAVFGSKAGSEQGEREEYFKKVLAGEVEFVPAVGGPRPSERGAESAEPGAEEVVRYVGEDAFAGDRSAVAISVESSLSLEERVALGVRYCRAAGFGGFRMVGSRLHLLRKAPSEIKERKRPLAGHTLVVVRRPRREKAELEIVPMGHLCATAVFLKQGGWRTQAYPLDRSCATLQVWDHMLSDNFKTLLTERGPRDRKIDHPYNKHFADVAMFLHQQGWANSSVARRVDRLRGVLARRRAFGLAMYFEGKKNIHATQQEVLAWAHKLARPERGFQHVALVWFEGEAPRQGGPPPSGHWALEAEHVSVLRYTPRRAMSYNSELAVEDVVCLSELLEARFPKVFTKFESGIATKSQDDDEVSEQDVNEDEDEVWENIWNYETGRFKGLESGAKDAKIAKDQDECQNVSIGLRVSSCKDKRTGMVVELPFTYKKQDFFMICFDNTGKIGPRPLENFRTPDGRKLAAEAGGQAAKRIGRCGDCRQTKADVLNARVGNLQYCIPCWCKDWRSWG